MAQDTTYPLFYEASEYTDDNSWKIILRNAAKGKFPKGFSYNSGYLIYKEKNKISQVIIPEQPALAAIELIAFIREKGGIISEKDRNNVERRSRCSKELPEKWSLVKNKDKKILIDYFTDQLSQCFQLTSAEKTTLLNQINIGFILGCFNSQTILMEDGFIVEIKGLEFNEEKRTFFINYRKAPIQKKKSTENSNEKKNRSFYHDWIKFIQQIDHPKNQTVTITQSITSNETDFNTE